MGVILIVVFFFLFFIGMGSLLGLFQMGALIFQSGQRKFEPFINKSDAICLKCGHIKTLAGSPARQYDIVNEDDYIAPAVRKCPKCGEKSNGSSNMADLLILNSAHLYYGMRSDLHPLGEMGYVSDCIRRGVGWETELPEVAKLRNKKQHDMSDN